MMKKIIVIVAVTIAFVGGGYLFVAKNAQTAAEEAIAEIERNIEESIPNSDFTFGEVSADVFANAAHVSDLALKVNGETLVNADLLAISGDELTIKSAELTGVEGYIKNSDVDLNFSVKSILVADADIESANKLIEELKVDPAAAIKAVNDFSIGELDVRGLSFALNEDGKEYLQLNGEVRLVGIKNGAIEILNMAGSLKDKSGVFFGDTIDGSLNRINISGFDFGNLLTAVAMENEQLLIAQLQNGFGISAVSIEGLVTNINDEVKANLTNGTIEIVDSVIETFSLTDFGFTHENEKVALTIGEAQFKGLDLGFDYFSEEALIENAVQLYGLTGIGLNNALFIFEGEEFGIGELSLTDVAFEDGMLVKSKIALNGIKIPLSLIEEINPSAARTIETFTGSESFTLSFSNSNDLDTEEGTYDTELNFGIEGFAEVKLNAALAGLDVTQIRKASKVNNILEAMEIWGEVSKELSIASVSLEYTDDQLADVMLSEAPDVSQLVMMSGMQIDMVLGQYPKQADQLKASIKAFLEGKNGFKVSMNAQSPVKIMDMQQMFMSGDMANSIIVAFEGS